ncbi:MAG: hypothetical protein DRO39_05220 [Thermoprotei archaeon]|nr:MAG: hypothetical protein DRO39_05220 [Thermoprotei archaeon]
MSIAPQVKIDEVMAEPPVVAKPLMTIGEILGKMRETRAWIVPVVDNKGRLIGVLSYRAILMRGAGRQTKVLTVMEPPYSVRLGTPFNDAVARFVALKARAMPVVDEHRILKGYVTRADLLRFMLENDVLPRKRAEELMTSPAVTIHEDESIARARWLMLRGGISRLPVVDEEEKLVGVISMRDIVERLYNIRLTRRKGFEQFEEEFLAAPVRDFMSTPPIYVARTSPSEEIVETLLEYNISGMPVVERDSVVGVVSGLDVLKAYVASLTVAHALEAKIPEEVRGDAITKNLVERLVSDYLASFRKFANVLDFKVTLKEETKVPKKEGRKRYKVRVRLVTDHGSFAAEGIGWELLSALRDALMTLEKRLRRYYEKRRTFQVTKGELAEEYMS